MPQVAIITEESSEEIKAGILGESVALQIAGREW